MDIEWSWRAKTFNYYLAFTNISVRIWWLDVYFRLLCTFSFLFASFGLSWCSDLFKHWLNWRTMRHNLKLWSMGQKLIMHKLDLVKEWVMKSLPFWIKNLPQISHILYYYTVTYIIFKLNSNTFFNEYQTSILVITRTRSKCIHRVRGEFGDGHYSYEYFWASTHLFFENRVFFNE